MFACVFLVFRFWLWIWCLQFVVFIWFLYCCGLCDFLIGGLEVLVLRLLTLVFNYWL